MEKEFKRGDIVLDCEGRTAEVIGVVGDIWCYSVVSGHATLTKCALKYPNGGTRYELANNLTLVTRGGIPAPPPEVPMKNTLTTEDHNQFLDRLTGEALVALGGGQKFSGIINDVVSQVQEREAIRLTPKKPSLAWIREELDRGPKADTVWEHYNGLSFRVLFIANVGNLSVDHPPQVVHVSLSSGEVYSRSILDWNRSMREIKK